MSFVLMVFRWTGIRSGGCSGSSGKVVELEGSDTCSQVCDSERGRNTKQMKGVEAIKSMVGI